MRSLVYASRTHGYRDVYPLLQAGLDELQGLEIEDGSKVVIKVNLCGFRHPSTGAITHPLFLDAVLRYLREGFKGLEIYVVESDATDSLPDITMRWFGFDRVIERWDAMWCNISRAPVAVKVINGRFFEELEVSKLFEDCSFFITMPKLKTHSLTKITCALKNQFGCIPFKRKVRFHGYLDDAIVDCNLAMKPDLCLVDGVISMVGGVALYGIPKKTNLFIAGLDPVAVDAFCATIFGYDPRRVGHIKKAERAGLGSMDFELVGSVDGLKVDRELSFLREKILNVGRALKRRFDREALA